MKFANLSTPSGSVICINLEQISIVAPCFPADNELTVAVETTDGRTRVVYVGEYEDGDCARWQRRALDLFWLQVEGGLVHLPW